METQDNEKLLLKLEEFSKINEPFREVYKLSMAKATTDQEKTDILLRFLAQNLLHVAEYCNQILSSLPEELPKILSILIFSSNKKDSFTYYTHRMNCIAIGKVIQKRPDLKMYAMQYFETNPSPFQEEFESKNPKKFKQTKHVVVDDIPLAECTYTLVKSATDFYKLKWEWSKFIPYLDHPSVYVKLFACHTLAIISGMNELQLSKLLKSKIPDLKKPDEITCEYDLKGTLSEKDKEIEIPRFINTTHGFECQVINVSGVYIPTVQKELGDFNLVKVESTVKNLRNIALGLSSNKAVCLQGPVGSGKTILVEYLAWKTGRTLGKNFVKVQLGDQTDSKMLLGTYRCTDVPGEFVWQPGVLTQAVLEGNWLFLEDIDSASMDIASVLTSLLENGSLTVPGYRDSVPIKPGFQLFVSQRLISTMTGHHKKLSNSMKLLEKHLLQVNIEPLSPEELKQVLNERYKCFHTIVDRMVNVFQLFGKKTAVIQKCNRLISTRDFFKWCSRAAVNFDISSQNSALKALQDAIDVFCCSNPSELEALNLAKEVSTQIGIINQKAEYFFKLYKPTMSLTPENLTVGRASIKRNLNNESSKKNSNFSFTRPSSVLLERIMCCVNSKEPVLLVGETGTGKTSSVQFLANTIGQKLVVINMNQQSDSADLLGGFKPVDLKFIITPVKREFESIFCEFFKIEPNKKFLGHITQCFNKQRWNDLVKLMSKSCEAAIKRLTNEQRQEKHEQFLKAWLKLEIKLQKLTVQLKQKTSLAFSFIEGSLVKAVENGYWVLLDEINLASAETVECLSGLLEDSDGSICLLERGDKKPISRHPNFTLFACMNPSTDVGKKDLPPGLRNRFTEFYVDELTDKNDLLLLVGQYLEAIHLKDKDLNRIVDFYLKVRKETVTILSDGLGHKPHYSLRSLCRALSIAASNPCGMFKKSLYEAFSLSFLTQLDSPSYKIVQATIGQYLLGSEKEIKAVLNQGISEPNVGGPWIQFEGYWVKGGNLEPDVPENYILTESVRRNLKDLVRVVSIGKLPVLLQGDTSVGKTSLISYLAKSSGNKCVRINNHEHTDLQEYIGSYVADTNGKLIFREGLLVEAMRKGHWIILDELNLAPTDVLEALNRVLDDNRELFIPETQETVRADPNFMLFATQNPPGVYGGRKMLSRAFRNRFVELHFNEIPPKELEFILHKRCQMAPSYAKKMISVMTDLQTRRRSSAAFAGKQGFITLRDLFRWGERYRLAQNTKNLYDWDQHIADEGYLVLAGRVRKTEEKNEIIEVLQTHLKRKVAPENLFTLSESTSSVTKYILESIYKNESKNETIVWTYNMRQLIVLVSKALQFKEPVLLVGETGGGKTTVCKLIAENNGQQLITVNCHMHTESSDFIGGLRPIRDHTGEQNATKLFEWVNGPLIQAMLQGNIFLADEISLADDSVLERLNSLLEPERTLLLSEKGVDINDPNNSELISADANFYFIGTMNPGGDFGKKELSPALRNRFTEIWCEPCNKREDLIEIVEKNVRPGLSLGNQEDGSSGIGSSIVNFVEWFKNTDIGKRFTVSIRDILTWVSFLNKCDQINAADAYFHGAALTFLDSLGSGITGTESRKHLETFRQSCHSFLSNQVAHLNHASLNLSVESISVDQKGNAFGVPPFYIKNGPHFENNNKNSFSFNAPTTLFNTLRLLRGMQLNKAILLEGSPGVGKTSLVSALAKTTGHKLFRVNLSDQTDISDLFGADLPVEGGVGGQFSWRDGPLLQALKQGDWILLDELNLASQSVLEGLNACLDHRGEIFIPELGKTFHVEPGTRFFGCQNPLKQGGSRRGLPRSFLNRFIQVYVNSLTDSDLAYILKNQFPMLPTEIVDGMIIFNCRLSRELECYNFGHKGSPWECNLRDLTRWCEVMVYNYANNPTLDKKYEPSGSVALIYSDRMRTSSDKRKVFELFGEVFKCEVTGRGPIMYVNKNRIFIGDVSIERNTSALDYGVLKQDNTSLVLRDQLPVLRSLLYCVNLNWMCILVGNSGAGKTSVVKTLASVCGKPLKILPVTSAMDTTDILGGFEQTDYTRHLDEIIKQTERLIMENLQHSLVESKTTEARDLLLHWEIFLNIAGSESNGTMEEEAKLFQKKLDKLENIWNKLCSLETFKNHNSIDKLKKKGQQMSEVVRKEGSLNAGGKFEWVDSVLIKCLQDGSWLLIDNVNLCSAAVLDRLNALLEPEGVLTIGERGVDCNGQMVEIKPHKDFRLFLTMDPKNGEISRAMRNRGIELYLLDHKETSTNTQDLKSLIHLQGLTKETHIKVLQSLHNLMSDLILTDKPNINDLLQASRIIAQQLNHGINQFEAFYSTIIEIYYKTKSPNSFTITDISGVIKEQILSKLGTDEENFKSGTVKTIDLLHSSRFAHIKQQSTLIQTDLNPDSLKYHLVNYYTIVSADDLNLRHEYLKTQLPNHGLILDELFSVVAQKKLHGLPYDFRWLPDTIYAEKNINLNNKTIVLLYFKVQLHEERKYLAGGRFKGSKEMSLLQYMTFRKTHKIEDIFNDILIDEFMDFIKVFDEVLINVLLNDSNNTDLDNSTTILTIYLLTWRFYFYKYAKINVKKISPAECHKQKMNLRVHYHWFVKYSCGEVFRLLGAEIPEKLSSILCNLNENIEKQFSALHKLSRLYKKHSHVPPPFVSGAQIEIVSRFNEILKRHGNIKKNAKLRDALIEIKRELSYNFDEHSYKATEDAIVAIQDQVLEKNFDLFSQNLLPLTDHFAQLFVKDFLLNKSGIENFRNNDCLPVELAGVLLRFCDENDTRLLHEINKLSYLYLMNSASVKICDLELMGHFPKISKLLCDLLIDEKGDYTVCSLGNFRKLTEQHEFLNHILWRNVQQLTYEKYDFVYFEKKQCCKMITEFITELSETLGVDCCENNILKQTQNCIEKLEKLDTKIFVEFLKKCMRDLTNLKANNFNLNHNLNVISDVYMEINYMKILLNSKLPLIDPLAKKSLKKVYCTENITNFETINECYKKQNEIYSNTDATIFPLYHTIGRKIKELQAKNHELGKYVAVRPEKVMYESVIKIVNSAIVTILSEKNIREALGKLNKYIVSYGNKETTTTRKEVEAYLKQSECAVISFENLITLWSGYCNSYPDVVEPLLGNLAQFLYGYKLKISLLRKVYLQREVATFDVDFANLIKFPSIDSTQISYREQIIAYTSGAFQGYIELVLQEGHEDKSAEIEKFRLLKCAIQDTYNNCVIDAKISGALNKQLFTDLEKLIQIFVNSWNKQQEELEKQKEENESLYKTRTKCDDLPEQEQIANELKEFFPSFHALDFNDMQENQELNDDVIEPVQIEGQFSKIIAEKDLKTIIDLHTILVQNFSKTEWLDPEVDKNVKVDLIVPLVEKFKLFKRIIGKVVTSLDYTIDKEVLSSLNVLLGVIMRYGNYNQLDEQVASPSKSNYKKKQDFYKDSDVEEVKSSYHILEELKIRINELLEEWPEQPTLMTILKVVERIYSFDITSPLSRFLTGFEILLKKCHEWEEVAHSGVTLSQFSTNITQQIITWRKKELGMWKELLNTTFERMNEPRTKWWLYLYNAMSQYIFEKTITDKELIETLQTFVTKSNLAEFQSRLDLLYTFHCHATHLEYSEERESFVSILWNLYQYFMQFSAIISNRIKDLRAPVEKKLKDYVKIVRWNDISYWSIKETMEKSHKYLHKFIREFKEVLMQPVTPYLTNISSGASEEVNVGIWDRPQRQYPKTYHYTLDADAYIIKLKKNIPDDKLENYLLKSRKFCKEIILATKYPNLVQNLEGFLNQVIETSNYLQKLEVDTTLSKSKQKSQAKSILNQKHRSLADLFKNLSKIGLSFRTGIIESKLKAESSDFVLKPIDLNASFSHLNCRRRDEKILTIWDSCEGYYLKSLIRADVLETAMKNPAQDLGMQNLERCKGFTSHLLTLAQKQKSELIETSRTFYYLRFYCDQITNACEAKETLHISVINSIQATLKSTLIAMQQCKIILNTCPEENVLSSQTPSVPILQPVSENFIKFKHDDTWNTLTGLISDIIAISSKLLAGLEKAKFVVPSVEKQLIYFQYVNVQDLGAIKSDINCILTKLAELELYNFTVISKCINYLTSELTRLCKQLNEETSFPLNVEELKGQTDKLIHKILVVIQNIYKKYSTESCENPEDTIVFEKHLKKLMIKDLSQDISLLQMNEILTDVQGVATILSVIPVAKNEEFKSVVQKITPLLEQIILLHEYFLTQQVSSYRVTCKMASILLNIFIELATKGFCIPPELSDEMNEEGVSKPSDGLGLGEGEGERDVSDKIESEDQLEDAQPAGQEKEKDDDKDCKEEEKGIEMSEDFDSKLQDKEKKEGEEDEDDENSDDSDAEQQMGETEKGADKLDQEIWGSDNEETEENDQNNEEQKDEKGNKGEKETEPELTANEENSKQNEDQESEKQGEQEKSKKEINELEEPEFDDEQTDPYHGNQPELPEPEAMDLPEDLQLDEGEEKNNETPEENPFDIDTMKEQLPDGAEEEPSQQEEPEKKNDEAEEFSSDDEDITNKEEQDKDNNAEPEETNKEQKEGDAIEENAKPNTEEDEVGDETETQEEDQSALDQTQSNELDLEAMETDNAAAADKTQSANSENQKSEDSIDELNQEDKPNKEGVGQSKMDESQTGHSAQTSAPQDMQSSKREREEDVRETQKPGESDSQRTLGDVNESVKKKLKTVDAQEKDNNDEPNNEESASEIYKHIKEGKENTSQVLDVATKEQTEAQQKEVPNLEEEEVAEEPTESSSDLPPEEEKIEDVEMKDGTEQINPEKQGSKKDKKSQQQHPEGEILDEVQDVEIEGDVVLTSTVPRSEESSYHTQFNDMKDVAESLTVQEINSLRSEVEHHLSAWNEPPPNSEAEQIWHKISSVTSSLAQDLSEQLRLVLEPTLASHLKGDFRTGRRINMRKIIPYIASQFRKDKIWLRRTKPSKREYQIVLAIDDSSSMADNKSKELAFESVSLISKALTLLESGQLSVLRFGETIEIIHKLTDSFTEKSGVKLLQTFKFDQNKTCVARLVDFASEMLLQSQMQSTVLNAKLLVIVSDGRGVFSEGEAYVRQAVRRAALANIFMIFIIIDNPDNKNSILDIRMPVFKDGKLLGIQSYMDEFPFSFYIILKDIKSLPNVLSDALRQWFEIVSNVD